MLKFRVHVYAEVRFPVAIEAANPREAADKALNTIDLYAAARSGGDYAEEVHGVLVDTLDEAGEVVTSVDLTPEEGNGTLAVRDDRDLATILAALRHWQECIPHPERKTVTPDHFPDQEPLTNTEIDSLCDRLNCTGDRFTIQVSVPGDHDQDSYYIGALIAPPGMDEIAACAAIDQMWGTWREAVPQPEADCKFINWVAENKKGWEELHDDNTIPHTIEE